MTASPASPIPAPKEKLRFSEVDSLRAVACALVVIGHTGILFNKVSGASFGIYSFARGSGILGVFIFFIISGYVIPRSLRGERWFGLKRFAIRRFWRLYPPFWFSLIIIYLTGKSVFSNIQYIGGASLLPSIFGTPLISGHFWTLEIEMLFYLTVASLFLVFGNMGWKTILPVYLSLILIGLFFNEDVRWAGGGNYLVRTPLYFSLMFYGALCREIISLNFHGNRKWLKAITIGSVTGALSLWPLHIGYFGWVENDIYPIESFFVLFSTILIFLFWVILTPVRMPTVSRIGRWTYSVYLLHQLPINLLYINIHSGKLNYFKGWPLPLYCILLLPICFLLGAIAYRWIEQPSDRVGKRIAG